MTPEQMQIRELKITLNKILEQLVIMNKRQALHEKATLAEQKKGLKLRK
tara:strand:+ start:622 stop:768 length:147 start_codon:yes stop_codon:yes gene_type:complete